MAQELKLDYKITKGMCQDFDEQTQSTDKAYLLYNLKNQIIDNKATNALTNELGTIVQALKDKINSGTLNIQGSIIGTIQCSYEKVALFTKAKNPLYKAATTNIITVSARRRAKRRAPASSTLGFTVGLYTPSDLYINDDDTTNFLWEFQENNATILELLNSYNDVKLVYGFYEGRILNDADLEIDINEFEKIAVYESDLLSSSTLGTGSINPGAQEYIESPDYIKFVYLTATSKDGSTKYRSNIRLLSHDTDWKTMWETSQDGGATLTKASNNLAVNSYEATWTGVGADSGITTYTYYTTPSFKRDGNTITVNPGYITYGNTDGILTLNGSTALTYTLKEGENNVQFTIEYTYEESSKNTRTIVLSFSYSSGETKVLLTCYFYLTEEDSDPYGKCTGYAGDAITFPLDPEKDGYIFNGWTSNTSTYAITTLTEIPESGITFYAVFEADSSQEEQVLYTYIFLDSYGNQLSTDSYFNPPVTVPEIEGLSFIGWEKVLSQCTIQTLIFRALYQEGDLNTSGKSLYYLTFLDKSGTTIAYYQIIEGASLPEAPTPPEVANYTFKEWSPSIPEVMPSENLTIKATYIKDTLSEYIDSIYVIETNAVDNVLNCRLVAQGDFNIGDYIDGVFCYENSTLQKIYWVDGKNLLRFLNISEDNPMFDSGEYCTDANKLNSSPSFNLNHRMEIKRHSGGGHFTAGVILYAFTYFNKYGAETSIVDVSPLCYVSDEKRGLSAEETVGCSFEVIIHNPDTLFEFIRLYSILRTSLDGQPICRIVKDIKISKSE